MALNSLATFKGIMLFSWELPTGLIPCESKRFSVGKREIERSQKVKQLDQIYLSRQTTTKMQQSFVRKFVQIDTALGEGIPISSNIHMKTNT